MIPLYQAKNKTCNFFSINPWIHDQVTAIKVEGTVEGKLEGVGCLDHVKAGMGVVCLKNEASVFETFLRGAKKKKTKNDSRERERERATCSSTLSDDHKDWVSGRALRLVKCSCCYLSDCFREVSVVQIFKKKTFQWMVGGWFHEWGFWIFWTWYTRWAPTSYKFKYIRL